MKQFFKYAAVALVALCAISCGNRKKALLPNISGKPGEIVTVISKADWEGSLGAVIRDTLCAEFPFLPQREPMYEIVKINLNHCDSTDITVVPMFGSKRAARLVEYRDKLGGFHSLSQLREVFVLQDIPMDLLEKYFVVHPADIRKININTATYKEMVNHPYFDAYLTKTILNYRSRNGDITSFEELQQITHAYPELMEKLRWYVVF